MKNESPGFEKEISDFITSMEKSVESQKPKESQEDSSQPEQNTGNHLPYFFEFMSGVQNSLRLIKNYTKISRTNESDNGLGEYFSQISDEVENLESAINCFLKFNRLNAPIKKRNTIHNLIEEVLKKHEDRLVEREILIFRRFEQGLPETIVPDELLKYILNSVLEYAIASTAPGGGIGFSTRSSNTEGGLEKEQSLPEKQKKQVEILVIFTNHKRRMEESAELSEMHKRQATDDALELILHLVKEVVQRNHGAMGVNVDGKKGKTFVLLKLPIERRELVYYRAENQQIKNSAR